ncbi:hypothetical protein EV426DRAFT_326429 [Tirmania nivea]|nr:hypothetical protein EV426DRAFT_326429 [Tirmania nivea]
MENDQPRQSPSARDPQALPFYPVPTPHVQSRVYLQPPMTHVAESVKQASAQFPARPLYSASMLPARDATPTDSAITEPYGGLSGGEWLPKFQVISPLELPPTASWAMTPARNQPPLQIPTPGQLTAITLKPGQPITGTMPSPTYQRPSLRTRRESHPFYDLPIFPKRVLKDTVTSYNQFWPYLVSPRRHTVNIPESEDWDEKSLYRAYLYRNRYPTLLTLTLLLLSLLPFAILLILLFSCYNVGTHPGYNLLMRDYCITSNVLTALFPLSICVAACWGTIWAFRERVVVFWLSMSQDDYKWKYIPARKGTVLVSWGAFEGPGLEDLYVQGISVPQGKPPQTKAPPKAANPQLAPGTLRSSVRPGAVVHWSDLDYTIENGTLEDFLSPPEIGALYNITLPKAEAGQYPIHFSSDSLEGIELHDLEPQKDEDLNPDAPGLTQEEKLRRWREMRRRELYSGLISEMNVGAGSSEEDRKRPTEIPLTAGSSAGEWGGWISSLNKRRGMLKGKFIDKGKGRATDVPVPEREFDISAPII